MSSNPLPRRLKTVLSRRWRITLHPDRRGLTLAFTIRNHPIALGGIVASVRLAGNQRGLHWNSYTWRGAQGLWDER